MNVLMIEVPFVRRSAGKATTLVSKLPLPATAPPPRIARMLALAHEMLGLLRDGTVANQRELALLMNFTRARITQLLDLTLLAPDIQEEILFASRTVSARTLERIARSIDWSDQRRRWRRLRSHYV